MKDRSRVNATRASIDDTVTILQELHNFVSMVSLFQPCCVLRGITEVNFFQKSFIIRFYWVGNDPKSVARLINIDYSRKYFSFNCDKEYSINAEKAENLLAAFDALCASAAANVLIGSIR